MAAKTEQEMAAEKEAAEQSQKRGELMHLHSMGFHFLANDVAKGWNINLSGDEENE